MLFSLALFGLLVGMMIGRLNAPEPVRLERVESHGAGLALWFTREPELRAEHFDGAFAMLFKAAGEPRMGRLALGKGPARWRIQKTEEGLLLRVIAARPLRAEWHATAEDGGWRLTISAREE